VGQGPVDQVGEHGLDDCVLAVGDVGVGDRFVKRLLREHASTTGL
jgi:hypothetical protein